jgi:hypothetical protein
MIWRPRGSEDGITYFILLFSSALQDSTGMLPTGRYCPTVRDAGHRPRPRAVAILFACTEERGHGDLNAAHLSLYRPQVGTYTTE